MAIKKDLHVVSGLQLEVYTDDGATDTSLPVTVFFLLHGRYGSTNSDYLQKSLNGIFEECYGPHSASERRRDLVVVAFDQRNHGHRLVKEEANVAWYERGKHNEKHAIDQYTIQAGTALDVSFLINFLPSYLYPSGERKIEEWGTGGISLGGHASWIALSKEPRLSFGVPIIGCPDYISLMTQRAQRASVPFAPPVIPDSFLEYVKKNDPAQQPFKATNQSNPFLGKKICVLSGGEDTLVPWTSSKEFVEGLEVGDGVKEVFVEEGAGHECTPAMVDKLAKFVWRMSLNGMDETGGASTATIRVTGHGKMKDFIRHALEHFQSKPGEPLTFKTPPTEVGSSAIPRLVSVVEIVKREYLKSLDAASGQLDGLHQYNRLLAVRQEIGEGADGNVDLAQALEGKNHPKQILHPYMEVILSKSALTDHATGDATYQAPERKRVGKAARERAKRRERKEREAGNVDIT